MNTNFKLLAGVVVSILACSCQASGLASGRSAYPCEPDRHQVLTARLSRLAPSQVFVVPPGTRPWVSTSDRPDPEQLFAGIGGVIDVSVTPAGATPHTATDDNGRTRSDDPTVDLRTTGSWYRLPVANGAWQIYTVDLGATDVQVRVIACADH